MVPHRRQPHGTGNTRGYRSGAPLVWCMPIGVRGWQKSGGDGESAGRKSTNTTREEVPLWTAMTSPPVSRWRVRFCYRQTKTRKIDSLINGCGIINTRARRYTRQRRRCEWLSRDRRLWRGCWPRTLLWHFFLLLLCRRPYPFGFRFRTCHAMYPCYPPKNDMPYQRTRIRAFLLACRVLRHVHGSGGRARRGGHTTRSTWPTRFSMWKPFFFNVSRYAAFVIG